MDRQLTDEELEWIKNQDIDPDLYSGQYHGAGIKLTQLWNIIKRYILRGDYRYQSGGLAVLGALIFYLPVDEAAQVLDEYFKKYDYAPRDAGERGGVNLTLLKAVYAVATTPDWHYQFDSATGPKFPQKAPMIALLEKYKDVLGNYISEDVPSVEETIDAIRNDKAGFEPRYPASANFSSEPWFDEEASDGPSDTSKLLTSSSSNNITVEYVEATVARSLDELRRELSQSSFSQMDIITAKHGYDMLNFQLISNKELLEARVEGLQRAVDRYMGERQVQIGTAQVAGQNKANWLAIAGIGLALALGVASLIISIVK
jgi:hypothetical protein